MLQTQKSAQKVLSATGKGLITVHCTLQPAKTTFKTHQLILTHTEVNIYVNFGTKFPLNNRQPSKTVKFNRQPSKLEKINRQPSKLTRHYHPP